MLMATDTKSVYSYPVENFCGETALPGDKSISHRALIVGSQAIGKTLIHGLLEAEDVMATMDALKNFGVEVEKNKSGSWTVWGTGVGSFCEPEQELYLGNSGTSARLLMGLAATHPFTTFITGDASLLGRPMERVVEPLTRMGATILTRGESHLPMAITGTRNLIPINYRLPVASAQVKSAILLAGLATAGKTSVIENVSSRDHTERMLYYFGADITVESNKSSGKRISINGQRELNATEICIPSDISSAAFLMAATLITQKGELLIKNVGINALRSGILECIREMGGYIRLIGNNEMSGEPVADICVKPSKLHSINVSADRAPSMIDEYPVLAVLAACASGTSHFKGLGELRHKESDRFTAIKTGLSRCGINVMEKGDDLLIEGKPEGLLGGIEIESSLDHRIAMAFLVLGMVCRKGIAVDDIRPIKTSFPGFIDLMNNLGGKIRSGE